MLDIVHPVHGCGQARCAQTGMARRAVLVDNLCMLRTPPIPARQQTMIRAWRLHRGMSLEELAERINQMMQRVHTTHGTLSRVERALVPYNQDLLEALADALDASPSDLLTRDPGDMPDVWDIWLRSDAAQRATLTRVAQAVTTFDHDHATTPQGASLSTKTRRSAKS